LQDFGFGSFRELILINLFLLVFDSQEFVARFLTPFAFRDHKYRYFVVLEAVILGALSLCMALVTHR